jgi:hypothetical protein
MTMALSIPIGRTNVEFTSPEQIMRWVKMNGYMVEPTKHGIKIIDQNNSTIFEY